MTERPMIGTDGWFQCKQCERPCRGIVTFTQNLSECCYAPMRRRTLQDVGPEIVKP